MIGFEWTVAKLFWYLLFMFFTYLYFPFYGMMAVSMTPDHNIAAIVSFGFYLMWNLFSGFVIPRTRIPIWWRWVCTVAWTLYGWFASQFGDVKDKMESGETVEEFLRDYFGYRRDFLGISATVVAGVSVSFGLISAFSIKAF